MTFAMAGYDLIHHGEGRWNGVAIAVRQGMRVADIVTNFGDGPVRDSGPGSVAVAEEDFDPLDEARMLALTVSDGRRADPAREPVRARTAASSTRRSTLGKLRWYDRLRRWLDEAADPGEPLLIGGDFNIAPTDADVWDPRAAHGGTHVSEPERAAFRELLDWGLVDVYRERAAGARPLHVVGLPGRQLPQELRDAHRPPPRDRGRSPNGSSGPRSTARRARASRSRRTTRRGRRPRHARAGRSTPAGPKPASGSPPAPASGRADRWPPTTTTSSRTWRIDSTPEEITEILGNGPDLARWWPSVYLDVEQLEEGGRATGSARSSACTPRAGCRTRCAGASGSPRTAVRTASRSRRSATSSGAGIWTFEQVGDETVVDLRLEDLGREGLLQDVSRSS